MVIQRRLKGLIVEFDIDQQTLADLLGITRVMLNRKINGKANFTLKEAFIISDYFGKKIDEIFLPTMYTQKEQNETA